MVAAVVVGAQATKAELECRRSCVLHVMKVAANLAEEVVNDTGEGGCCFSRLLYSTSKALVSWSKLSRNPMIGVEGSRFRVEAFSQNLPKTSFALATNRWVLSPSSAPAGKGILVKGSSFDALRST